MLVCDRQFAATLLARCVLVMVVCLFSANILEAGFITTSGFGNSTETNLYSDFGEDFLTSSSSKSSTPGEVLKPNEPLAQWRSQTQTALIQNSGFSGMSSGSSSLNSSPPPAALSTPLELSPPASFVQGVPRAFYSPRVCVTGVFRPPMSV